jgi:hypothetical protein
VVRSQVAPWGSQSGVCSVLGMSKRFLLLFVLGLCTAAVAGCGGSDDSSRGGGGGEGGGCGELTGTNEPCGLTI